MKTEIWCSCIAHGFYPGDASACPKCPPALVDIAAQHVAIAERHAAAGPRWVDDAPPSPPLPVSYDDDVTTDQVIKIDNLVRGEFETGNWIPDAQPAAPASRRYLPTESAARKRIPMAAGLLDYFPDALAAVAEVSFLGNEKHNPGEPLHHARGKSTDHADCIIRHLVNRGGFDGDARESAAMAWRALALLQEELEREVDLSLPRGARL